MRLAPCTLLTFGVVGAAVAWTTLLAACGGDATTPSSVAASPAPARAETGASPAPSARLVPLLDDEGRPAFSLPQAQPSDPGARTRARQYALRAQARELDRALGANVLWLAADCCGSHAVDVAAGVAHASMAAEGLRRDAPVFVHGRDLRVAAMVADRLGSDGLSRVFLVTD